jgi:glycosyltransferase involved in cell wall biosynthesis
MKLLSVDVELPLPAIPRRTCGEQWVLLRLHGDPLGILYTGQDGCTSGELARLILEHHAWAIARHLVADGFGSSSIGEMAHLPKACARRRAEPHTVVTVAVCTRNRAAQLPACLEALEALDYPRHLLDVVIVDNAPIDDSTRAAVERFPSFRYVLEPRPGLDRARNRAIVESRGEIIAYTDDDVSVDPAWLHAIANAFLEEPDAMCITGLVVPDEVDTEAQVLFERYGGFGRGFDRNVFRVDLESGQSTARLYGGTGRFGTGANMAFRRCFFDAAGPFDPGLDVGTPANGGGDLDMFFRVLKSGASLVYEPAAIVRHRHRRDLPALRTQITNNGIGFYSYLVRTARAYPDERTAIVRLGLWWLWWWSIRRLLRSFVRPAPIPRSLMIAELIGSVVGLRRYEGVPRARETAS